MKALSSGLGSRLDGSKNERPREHTCTAGTHAVGHKIPQGQDDVLAEALPTANTQCGARTPCIPD